MNALLWLVHCYLLLFIVLFIALSLLFDRCFNSVLLLVSTVSGELSMLLIDCPCFSLHVFMLSLRCYVSSVCYCVCCV